MSFTNKLPDSLKVVRSNSTNPLEAYKLNPLLLTAYLLDVTNSNSIYQKGLEDFKRTYRLKDSLASADILYQPEIYKGFLAFKSTKYDLIYYLRQLGLDAVVEEMSPSGIIDPVWGISKIDGSWKLSGSVKLGNLASDPSLTSNACDIGIKATINIRTASTSANVIQLVYNKISNLLMNRLASFTYLSYLLFEINIISDFDYNSIYDNKGVQFVIAATDEVTNATVINNATPLKINPSGSVIGGYRLSDAYQVN